MGVRVGSPGVTVGMAVVGRGVGVVVGAGLGRGDGAGETVGWELGRAGSVKT